MFWPLISKKTFFFRFMLYALITSYLGCNIAMANVVVLGTRVIYPQNEREVTVQLNNSGERPSLVQAWIDNGDTKVPINKIKVPFVLMPPVFRIDSGKGQTLRIVYTGEALPQDKESVFWLNVLDIPPKSDAVENGSNLLQMAIRSRIKIFFRPPAVNDEGAADAAKKIYWTPSGDRKDLQGKNTSPYYVSISSVDIESGGKKISSLEGVMIPPGETRLFKMAISSGFYAGKKLSYKAINDYGGVTRVESIIN